MSVRYELGIARTSCACEQCTECCRQVPGYLLPADLTRMMGPRWQTWLVDPTNAGVVEWATTNLLASPGALVSKDGVPFRIRTLVPRRQADGSCLHLTPAGGCAIHEVAPWGCAFFEKHMDYELGRQRSALGLAEVCKAWANDVRPAYRLYVSLWITLYRAGHVADGPEKGWKR